MRFTIMLVATLLLPSSVVRAEDKGTMVLGDGIESCGKFIAASTDNKPGSYKRMDTPTGRYVNEISRYQQWFMGFVSGLNSSYPDDLSKQIKVDLAGLDLWMRNWCNQHPVNTVFDGMIAFRDEMQRR
jgi:hypothetical protein